VPKQAQDKRILNPPAHQLYSYRLGYRFDPGAPAEAFIPFTTLNPVLAMRGRGTLAGEIARPLQPPQIWFSPQVIKSSIGGGGRIAGQLALQALVDTSTPAADPVTPI
jgi:hypothetical protein